MLIQSETAYKCAYVRGGTTHVETVYSAREAADFMRRYKSAGAAVRKVVTLTFIEKRWDERFD